MASTNPFYDLYYNKYMAYEVDEAFLQSKVTAGRISAAEKHSIIYDRLERDYVVNKTINEAVLDTYVTNGHITAEDKAAIMAFSYETAKAAGTV